jgi:hypothetical protein
MYRGLKFFASFALAHFLLNVGFYGDALILTLAGHGSVLHHIHHELRGNVVAVQLLAELLTKLFKLRLRHHPGARYHDREIASASVTRNL